MADYKKFVPFVLKWEGGVSNNAADTGGLTNKGITYTTYKSLAKKVLNQEPTYAGFYALTNDQAGLFIKYYWDIATGGNKVLSQAISEVLTSWMWGSGTGGLKSFQKMLNDRYNLNLKVDGVIGPASLTAINLIPESKLFRDSIETRKQFFNDIVKNNPSQKVFLNGWLNRLSSFEDKWSDYFKKKNG